jgi:predicted PurR-regulated permease PerM
VLSDGDRAFVRRLLITIAILAVVLAAWRVAQVLLLVFASVLVAILFQALAAPVSRHAGVPPRLALALAVAGVVALVAGSMWLFGSEFAAQLRVLRDALPAAFDALERQLGEIGLGEELRQGMSDAVPEPSSVVSGLRRALFSVGNAVAGTVLVFVGGIYLAAQPDLYRKGLLKLVPAVRRPLLAQSLEETSHALRLWLLAQLVSMVVIGLLTGIGLALIGIPSALALGLLAGLAEFVPVVGPFVAAVPGLLVALSQGNDAALLAFALYVGVQQLEGNVLTPLVQQRIADLPAALLLFAVVAAGLLFGGLGVLLAAPLTVALYVLVKRLYVREALDTPTPIPGEKTPGEKAPGGEGVGDAGRD